MLISSSLTQRMLARTIALLILLWILFVLAACSVAPPQVTPPPAQTLVPTPTATPVANTVGGFPFPTGTTWVYSHVAYQQALGDPTRIITATNVLTETVLGPEGDSSSPLFRYRVTNSPLDAPPGWALNPPDPNLDLWYQIVGSRVLAFRTRVSAETRTVAYEFPLEAGDNWCPQQPPPDYNPGCNAMGRRIVWERTRYSTPVGTFEECFEIGQEFNSGGVTEWFCDGIGVVARKYDHGGTRFGFEETLIRYTRPR